MMAAWREPRNPRRSRKVVSSSGLFGITSPGISERINTSAPGLGMAISKALTLANRLQRELQASKDEEDVTIRITPLGGELAARVVVRRDVIECFTNRST